MFTCHLSVRCTEFSVLAKWNRLFIKKKNRFQLNWLSNPNLTTYFHSWESLTKVPNAYLRPPSLRPNTGHIKIVLRFGDIPHIVLLVRTLHDIIKFAKLVPPSRNFINNGNQSVCLSCLNPTEGSRFQIFCRGLRPLKPVWRSAALLNIETTCLYHSDKYLIIKTAVHGVSRFSKSMPRTRDLVISCISRPRIFVRMARVTLPHENSISGNQRSRCQTTLNPWTVRGERGRRHSPRGFFAIWKADFNSAILKLSEAFHSPLTKILMCQLFLHSFKTFS